MLYTGPQPANPLHFAPRVLHCQTLKSMEVFEFLMPIFTEYGYLAVFVMLLVCET